MAEERNGQRYAATSIYRVSPRGNVTRYAIPMFSSPVLTPATIFAANGYIWGVAVTAYGPEAGSARLVRIDSSGTVVTAPIDGPRGSIASENASIPAVGDTAFLTGFSGALAELTYSP